MFEALMREKRERGLAQPMLSFAIHAGLIALAVGRVSQPSKAPPSVDPPIFEEWSVIVDRDGGGTSGNVGSGHEDEVPRPILIPGLPLPGPIQVDDRPGPDRLPGIPTGIPGRSILDSARSGLPTVYTEGDLTDSPVLVHFPQPVYPPALKAAGVEGKVQIAYVVDSDGRVEPGSIIIVSSDHLLMSESVRVSLRAAQFRPGMVRGIPVRTLVRQTIRFSLMPL